MNLEQKKAINRIPIMIIVFIVLIVVNLLFVMFSSNEAKTISLLKNELVVLERDQKIVAASANISEVYRDEIEVISQVFPTEETIPEFIQIFEEKIGVYSDAYSLKFNSLSPLKEGDVLYLPLIITIKTDMARFFELLTEIEKMHYMTHIYSLNVKSPEGFAQSSEITIGLKVYVQNPFTSQ